MRVVYETTEKGLNVGLRKDNLGLYYLYWVSGDEMQSRPMLKGDLVLWATDLYNPVPYASLPVMAEFILGEMP